MHFKSDDSTSGRSNKKYLLKISKLPENQIIDEHFQQEGGNHVLFDMHLFRK